MTSSDFGQISSVHSSASFRKNKDGGTHLQTLQAKAAFAKRGGEHILPLRSFFRLMNGVRLNSSYDLTSLHVKIYEKDTAFNVVELYKLNAHVIGLPQG